MKILYGVVGEGMGHATRSRVLLESLTRRHEVHVVASGRAYEFLKARFPHVHKIHGAVLASEENVVKKRATVAVNLRGAVGGVPENIRQYFTLADEIDPECVISDFDSFAYFYALNWMLPVLSIDNMQIINRCEHAPAITAGCEGDFRLAKAIVKAKLPGCLHYLITTFFYPPVRKERTTLHPPILRPEIVAAKPERGEHLLVYQTSTSNSELVEALQAAKLPCRVYGLKRDLTEELVDGNLTYRPFSEQGFIDDLRTSRAVVASGGFTLMGEAVHLHKPMLCVPLRGQFEQTLNRRYLEDEGYGLCVPSVTSGTLTRFLGQLERYEEKVAGYTPEGRQTVEEKLGELLKQIEPAPLGPELGRTVFRRGF